MGTILGRWNIRYATGEKPIPDVPDPFDPLPVCPPGMLQGEDGLPLMETPPGCPIDIVWDAILVDDDGHPDDIIVRVRQVLEVLWGENAESIEAEACEILGVKSLRDYFRKPAKGGFWLDHVKRYSKSRRKAPIYWLLQSRDEKYALWLYYHRLDGDILYKVLANYVKPKINREESHLGRLRAQRSESGAIGAAGGEIEDEINDQQDYLNELRDFRDKLKRAAELGLQRDLNDGVVLNIAPLHEPVPWKEVGKYWNELLAGKYEWSSIGKQLREKELVE